MVYVTIENEEGIKKSVCFELSDPVCEKQAIGMLMNGVTKIIKSLHRMDEYLDMFDERCGFAGFSTISLS